MLNIKFVFISLKKFKFKNIIYCNSLNVRHQHSYCFYVVLWCVFFMILLIVFGVALYFILPLVIVMWLLKKNDYMIFGWKADVGLVAYGVMFIELVFLVQIFFG